MTSNRLQLRHRADIPLAWLLDGSIGARFGALSSLKLSYCKLSFPSSGLLVEGIP
jgi:hypothetical protein